MLAADRRPLIWLERCAVSTGYGYPQFYDPGYVSAYPYDYVPGYGGVLIGGGWGGYYRNQFNHGGYHGYGGYRMAMVTVAAVDTDELHASFVLMASRSFLCAARIFNVDVFRQSQATTKKAQAYWHHVNEIATETRSQLLTSSEKLVSQYVRETQVGINSFANNPPAASESIAALWSKGFGAMWDAGNALHEQTKSGAKEAMDVIDKAGKPVAKV